MNDNIFQSKKPRRGSEYLTFIILIILIWSGCFWFQSDFGPLGSELAQLINPVNLLLLITFMCQRPPVMEHPPSECVCVCVCNGEASFKGCLFAGHEMRSWDWWEVMLLVETVWKHEVLFADGEEEEEEKTEQLPGGGKSELEFVSWRVLNLRPNSRLTPRARATCLHHAHRHTINSPAKTARPWQQREVFQRYQTHTWDLRRALSSLI